MNVLDLFSGIGGFSLGLERAGMRTVAFCEIDPYCRAVLAKHWPDVPVFGDVRELTASSLVANANYQRQLQQGGTVGQERRWVGDCGVDVIAGGFPCQDISAAGKGAGITGSRSGLWSEYARIIGEVRPRYVIVENVAALLGRGIERVLGDLAALGFDAEWHCIPASAVGAPHRRDRVWIVAHPNGAEWRSERGTRNDHGADGHAQWQQGSNRSESSREDVADAGSVERWPTVRLVQSEIMDESRRDASSSFSSSSNKDVADADISHAPHYAAIGEGIRRGDTAGQWWVEPDVGRVAHGVPARVDRLRSLGNAVVPQIPEIIGRAIMHSHIAKLVIPR